MLFDVVNDPTEHHDVAAQNPDIVQQLLAKLNAYNNSYCSGERCLPDNAGGPRGTPTNKEWLPWRGDKNPAKCDTDRIVKTPAPPPPTPTGLHTSLSAASVKVENGVLEGDGWCWDATFAGGGVPAMTVQVSVDGKAVATVLANITRPNLKKTGAPNTEHGFQLHVGGQPASTLAAKDGKVHSLDLDVFLDASPSPTSDTAPLKGSPLCFKAGEQVSCP